MANCVVGAGTRYGAFVDVIAVHLTVPDVTGLALAQEVRREVAALRVLHASRGERRVIAFVDIYNERVTIRN